MREKKTWLVVTFYTTSAAMAAEKACLAAAVPGRIIPVPRQITSDCGLGWRTPPETRPPGRGPFHLPSIWRSRGTTCVSSDREMHSPSLPKKGKIHQNFEAVTDEWGHLFLRDAVHIISRLRRQLPPS